MASQPKSLPGGFEISLRDALAGIIELGGDLDSLPALTRTFSLVRVDSFMQGEVRFFFIGHSGDFDADWSDAYPALSHRQNCGSRTLLVAEAMPAISIDKVRQAAVKYLTPSLSVKDDAIWYAYRHDMRLPALPRAAYYLVAMFILGSVVRYEPEFLEPLAKPQNELGWIINRYLALAERFFPQLKLREQTGAELYVG